MPASSYVSYDGAVEHGPLGQGEALARLSQEHVQQTQHLLDVVQQGGPLAGGVGRWQVERVDAVGRRGGHSEKLPIHGLAQRAVLVFAVDDDDVGVVGQQQVAPREDLGEEGLSSAGRSEDPDVGVLTDAVVEQVQLHQAVRLLVDPEHDAARHARRCRDERVDRRQRAGVERMQDLELVPRFR